jgi:hypothetical protein
MCWAPGEAGWDLKATGQWPALWHGKTLGPPDSSNQGVGGDQGWGRPLCGEQRGEVAVVMGTLVDTSCLR